MEANRSNQDSYEYTLKYSRLLGVLEYDALRTLQASKILIVGARGLGAEIAKSLVMMGVSHIYIRDDRIMTSYDLSSSALFKEEDIGKNLALVLAVRLLVISEDVQVKIHTSDTYDGFDLVCVTEAKSETYINNINNICRTNRTPFIVGDVFGVFGFVFNDFGDEFTVSDAVNEDFLARHNDRSTTEIKRTMNFAPFSKLVSSRLGSKKLICQDTTKANNFIPLLRSLMNFRDHHGRSPLPWNTQDTREIFEQAKMFGCDLDEEFITPLSQVSAIEFAPVISVISGMMTHEIIKAVTRIGSPIDQFLFYECSDVLPQVPPEPLSETQVVSRYSDLEAMFGRDLLKRIQATKCP
eukprot:TRINITY_DN3854_c0_g1_i1.p2 TRINITY_DN3854_c0_g1~~TRINITY_DN3854_c0_g1_i1.p2  ORF type:complete len:353 (+),score=25.04 TRINITY_DN3854_c0_g1_i1:117-1175(+)